MITDEQIIDWLDNNNFTDRVDMGAEISLFEYGVIRNPLTNRTIFALTDGDTIIGIDWTDITLEDVKEALEKVKLGFYDFIGSTKEETLNNLTNDHLTSEINALRGYCNPWDSLDFIFNKQDIITIAISPETSTLT